MDVAKHEALLEDVFENSTVFQCFEKSIAVLDRSDSAVVSVSGGSDSDIIIDVCSKIRGDLRYTWFDTGMEYQATKDHLKYLEQRYGIKIERVRAKMPVPKSVAFYGYPFLAKQVSEYIGRLQNHGFDWKDAPYQELLQKYPKCKSAIAWWCNEWGDKSSFNINRWKYLKEFLIENPPTFHISAGCCKGAKKDTSHDWVKSNNVKLIVTGERKAEGGARVGTSSCFTENESSNHATFRPIFWFKDEDKEFYEKKFDIRHSECYWRYGLRRTGCVGCPFGRNWQFELEVVKAYEPKLYKLCTNVFGKSYEYTLQYRAFRQRKEEEETGFHQYSLFEKEGG